MKKTGNSNGARRINRQRVVFLFGLGLMACGARTGLMGSPVDSGAEDAVTSPMDAAGDEDALPPPTDAGDDALPPPTDAGDDALPPPTDAGDDALPPPLDAGDDAQPPPLDAGDDAQPPPLDAGDDAPPLLTMSCPSGPDDPRLPQLKLGVPTVLDGTGFVTGDVRSWHWDLVPEDCDAIVANPEFVLQGAESSQVTFQALRPAPYRFKLRVVGAAGDTGSCDFEVPTDGRGLRVELCWNTSQKTDLDLYLHNPFDREPWFIPSAQSVADGIDGHTCNVVNCTANLRLMRPRVDFHFPDSPASFCQAGPAAAEFQALGRCPNPREGEDNNQSLATGVAERIQLDAPSDAQTFRVMVQNFSNTPAEPHVFVYCSGQKAGEVSAPKSPTDFVAAVPGAFGVMWRAADITTQIRGGAPTRCSVSVPASPAGSTPYVTIDDPSF